MTGAVIGRQDELAMLKDFLEGVQGGPASLLLEGEPGIGKTFLWQEGVRLARERGYRILVARPAESEVQLAFAALGDLLEDVLSEVLELLPPLKRRALDAALLLGEAEGPPPDPRAVALGLLGVLRQLAASERVLLAIDDLQWLDTPSARALEFAIRRARGAVGVLASARTVEEHEEERSLDLRRALPDPLVRRLALGPLSMGAVHELLRTRLGIVFPRPTLLRVHEAANGNPFFALELARALKRAGAEPGAGEPLPVPMSLRDLVAGRLAQVGAQARETLLAVAFASQPTLELVGAVAEEATGQVELALRAGILEQDRERLRFTHPLLAAAQRAEATSGERERLHRALAAAVTDPEERAWHLALAARGPDPRVATALDDAARAARRRGASDAAAELAEQALRLTPLDARDTVQRRGTEAAEYHFEAGNLGRARTRLQELVASMPRGLARAHVLTRLAWTHGWWGDDPREANRLFEQAREESGQDLSALAEIEEGLAWNFHLSGDLEDAAVHARASADLSERTDDRPMLVQALTALAFFEALLGRTSAEAAIARAMALEDVVADRRVISGPRWIHAMFLASAGDVDSAREDFEGLYQRALERGDTSSLANLLEFYALAECRAGSWERARELAEEGQEAARESGQRFMLATILGVAALVEAHLGNVDAVRSLTAEGLAQAERARLDSVASPHRAVLGFLELSLDRPDEACRLLSPLLDGSPGPLICGPGWYRFLGDAIEALVAVGKLDRAQTLLARLMERTVVLDRAWSAAAAPRLRGLIQAARGELPEALRSFDEAIQLHEQLPEPFELGRTLLALGSVHRRAQQKRAARESLEQALSLFDELGARLWAERARTELGRIGGRRAPGGVMLSATEARIADLVAAGKTNKEIAAALSVSPRTVQWNLSKVYRKLGIRSRTELAVTASQARPKPGHAAE